MRTPAQRGPIGNWLRDERLSRGWSSAGVARANLERAGINVAASVYAEWESGTRIPSEAQLERLKAYYGTTPGTTGDQSDLAAAVRENTAMLKKVLEALTARLPEPPPEMFRDLTEAEAEAESEPANTRKPPRSIDRERRVGDRGRELPEAAAS